MAELQTFQNAYLQATAGNITYSRNQQRWKFLLDSYTGGQAYREGAYLQRYALENDTQYAVRLLNTPLDNQVRSLISLYTSFLFRTEPDREFGSLENNFTIENICKDADLDGRNMNAFMKDVAQWAAVFGHVWIAVAKPDVGAITMADEQSMGARPYLSMYNPLAVTDWRWARQPNGGYQLEYIKYVEEVNGTETVVKEWTYDTITTYNLDTLQERVNDMTVETNGLGYLPFVCAYAERSPVRGLGNSLVDDIADQQRMIYNELSEVYDSIRLDTHPSLVATAGTNAQGAAAGQVITMEENLDPNLKPYVLQFEGGQIDKIYTSINNRKAMIDSMGNVGAVRATETREMSGIAIETEFQLLNARLSSIADNLELAEEQIWSIIYTYMGYTWDGEIDYPDNFALRNIDNELSQLKTAFEIVRDPVKIALIENAVMDMIDIENPKHELAEELAEQQGVPSLDEEEIRYVYPDGTPISPDLPEAYDLATTNENCKNCGYYLEGLCTRWNNAPVKATYWCAAWEPVSE